MRAEMRRRLAAREGEGELEGECEEEDDEQPTRGQSTSASRSRGRSSRRGSRGGRSHHRLAVEQSQRTMIDLRAMMRDLKAQRMQDADTVVTRAIHRLKGLQFVKNMDQPHRLALFAYMTKERWADIVIALDDSDLVVWCHERMQKLRSEEEQKQRDLAARQQEQAHIQASRVSMPLPSPSPRLPLQPHYIAGSPVLQDQYP